MSYSHFSDNKVDAINTLFAFLASYLETYPVAVSGHSHLFSLDEEPGKCSAKYTSVHSVCLSVNK